MKIPVTIITGFLGVGKTTLINHILENAGDKRIALIINEFGDIGFDGEQIKECGIKNCKSEDIVELANGCICCTVADEFIPTMQMLLEREKRPHHIIIETSGLALPQPLVKAFNWPEIKTEVSIDGVITIVDGAALSEGRFAANEGEINKQREQDEMLDHKTPLGELFEDQLVCADLIVINKVDLISSNQLKKVEELVDREKREGVGIIKAQNAKVDLNALLGLELNSEDNFEGRESHHEKHHLHENHDHDDFRSFSLILEPSENKQQILAKIEAVIKAHDILRLKGYIAIKNNPSRLMVQAVGARVNFWFEREWKEGEIQQSSLVVIGLKGLDEEAIKKSLQG